MKERDNIDNELSKMLKEDSWQETQNQWFTSRVLNKLPAKENNSARHMAWGFYLAAVAVCIGFWAWLLFFGNPTVVTVRDILYTIIAGIVTLILAFTPLVSMFRE